MNAQRARRLIAAASLLTLLLLALTPAAYAFEGRSGDVIVIGADEVIEDDLYVGADTFRLDGIVKGDVIAAGTNITINGTIEGDLMAAGQSITLNGKVMDDVRIAGMAATLGQGSAVKDEVVMAGLSLETQVGSTVGGDLFLASAQGLLAGTVAGDVTANAESLELRGAIGGDLIAEVGAADAGIAAEGGFSPFMFIPDMPAIPVVPGGLTLGTAAKVGGDLRYTGPEEALVPSTVVTGITRFTKVIPEVAPEAPPPTVLDRVLPFVRTWVALFLVGLLMIWLVPKATERVGQLVAERPLPSFGWGFVTVAAVIGAIVVGVTVMIAAAVIFGLVTLDNLVGVVVWVGLLALFALLVAFGLSVAYASKITVCCEGGRAILSRIRPEWGAGRVVPLAIGLLIFVLLTAIPILGGLVNLIVVLIGLGGLWLLGRETLSPSAAPVEVEPA